MITNKKGETAQWGRLLFILASLILCIGLGAIQAFAAAPYVPQFSYNNNLSIDNGTGAVTGGANDVLVYWDGTLKTSVVASGQVINGYINAITNNGGFVQTCKTGTGGTAWKSHDVAFYGPGSYTVYAGCAAGSPGCGTGTAINFTVGTGEVGLHMLVDWGIVASNKNIDVVNVLTPGVFGPSAMWTGACGANATDKVWDKMSKDPGTGFNGYPMVDGPFIGTTWNFNMMGPSINRVVDTENNNFTMLDLDGNYIGGTNDVRFTWDGTKKTAVACPSESNATISSWCSFFGSGKTWAAHDVNIYGPGTYTVYDACSPGCANDPNCTNASGVNNPITFTVASGELGGHMLFFWNGNDNIDVVDIWQPNTVFAPKGLMDNLVNFIYGCGTNPASTVWDWMSSDWGSPDGAGGVVQIPNLINGAPMTDGPFGGSYANFNVMGSCSPADCNDNDQCTTDTCVNHICVHTPVVPASCNDNDACTVDGCTANACTNVALNCDDNNVCTTDSCNTATGCVHTNNTGSCDDGIACTDPDVCLNGVCTGTPIQNCCTGQLAGVPCSDGDACTDHDACDGLDHCVGTAVSCDDNNVCMTDTCNTATGCVHTPNTLPCSDNNACTTNDTCSGGSCVSGPALSCDDNNICTIDTCNIATGCIHTATVPSSCDDNDVCTTDGCTANACTHTAISCDDNKLCTTDTCNSATGCVHTAVVCTVASTVCDTATGSCVSTGGDIITPAGVSLADALFALRIAAGLEAPTAAQLLAGDVAPCVNGKSAPDGAINMGDVIVILRKALGLPTCL